MKIKQVNSRCRVVLSIEEVWGSSNLYELQYRVKGLFGYRWVQVASVTEWSSTHIDNIYQKLKKCRDDVRREKNHFHNTKLVY